jgi:hypothetical protein
VLNLNDKVTIFDLLKGDTSGGSWNFHHLWGKMHSEHDLLRTMYSQIRRGDWELLFLSILTALVIFKIIAILTGAWWSLIKVLTCSSLIASNVEHFKYIHWLFIFLLVRSIYFHLTDFKTYYEAAVITTVMV